MRRPALAALAAALTLTACGGDATGDGTAGGDGIEISDAWARVTPPGISVGAVYLTVAADADDALLGAAVDPAVAAAATLHVTTIDDGMSTMAPVASLPVSPATDLALDPLGDHLMLVGLADPLTAGERFEVTLRFRDAGDVRVAVDVREDAP